MVPLTGTPRSLHERNVRCHGPEGSVELALTKPRSNRAFDGVSVVHTADTLTLYLQQ